MRYQYQGSGSPRHKDTCEVKLRQNKLGDLLIIQENQEIEGSPLSLEIERIIENLCKGLNISLQGLAVIALTPQRDYQPHQPPTWHAIRFDFDWDRSILTNPIWQKLDAGEVLKLKETYPETIDLPDTFR